MILFETAPLSSVNHDRDCLFTSYLEAELAGDRFTAANSWWYDVYGGHMYVTVAAWRSLYIALVIIDGMQEFVLRAVTTPDDLLPTYTIRG